MWWYLSQNALLGAVESGLIYGFVGLGVYISFRVLDFPDLTVEGSFPLGAAVVVVAILAGYDPWLATLFAAIAGALAGLVTAALNQIGKIPNLLASILTSTALYSVNLHILGGANVPLMTGDTIFTPFSSSQISDAVMRPLVLALFGIIIIALLWRYFESNSGLAMRATGVNPRMSRAQGVSTAAQIFIGMALSNALVAIGGALFAQVNRYADSSLGIGTIVLGLAAVIIGSTFMPWKRIIFPLIGCFIGSIVYWVALAYALNGIPGMTPFDLNLVTAGLIAFVLIAIGKFGGALNDRT